MIKWLKSWISTIGILINRSLMKRIWKAEEEFKSRSVKDFDKPSAVIRSKTTEELAKSLADEFMDKHWNSKYNSELTTIKNKCMINGWIWGFITGLGLVLIFIVK